MGPTTADRPSKAELDAAAASLLGQLRAFSSGLDPAERLLFVSLLAPVVEQLVIEAQPSAVASSRAAEAPEVMSFVMTSADDRSLERALIRHVDHLFPASPEAADQAGTDAESE
jgi:hypothetical protein